MASYYWHEFIPSFSGVLLVTVVALVVIAFVTGYRSVKVRPRRVGGAKANPEAAPRFKSRKVALVRENFKRSLARRKKLADSVIVFRSATVDTLWALGAGIVFVLVFINEHWCGLVQFWINHLAADEGVAWGDIMAFVTAAVLGGAVSSMFYAVAAYGQWLHASKLVGKYLYKLNVRPIIKENPSLVFIARVLVWAIREELAERKAAKSNSEPAEEKPINCEVIDFNSHAI